MDARVGIDLPDARFDRCKLVGGNQIGLVEEHDVGEGELLLRFVSMIDLAQEMLGIDHGHDGVELGLAADIFVHEEGLRDRRRIGEPGGLDQDPVEATLAPHQPGEDADEIAADGAADAAVVHLENLFVRVDDEVIVDADLAEFVDDAA
jgi:hypothetical protein